MTTKKTQSNTDAIVEMCFLKVVYKLNLGITKAATRSQTLNYTVFTTLLKPAVVVPSSFVQSTVTDWRDAGSTLEGRCLSGRNGVWGNSRLTRPRCWHRALASLASWHLALAVLLYAGSFASTPFPAPITAEGARQGNRFLSSSSGGG